MHLSSTVKFAHQLSSRGYLYSAVTGFRATRILFHLTDHIKLVQLMHNNSELAILIRKYPRIIYRYLGDYLAVSFSTSKKLIILFHHYRFLLNNTHQDFFKRVQKRECIWQENRDDTQYRITLAFPFGRDCEGDLSLVFECNSTPIYILSFTFIPGSPLNFYFDQGIFVGRIQGLASFDLIRHTTKNLHDIAPPALLMAALQGVALACNIKAIIGISNQEQLSNNDSYNFFNYDLFWHSLGATQTKENLFSLPVPLVEKSIELVKSNHRRRTLCKRQYKHQVRQEVFNKFGNLL